MKSHVDPTDNYGPFAGEGTMGGNPRGGPSNRGYRGGGGVSRTLSKIC